MDYTGFMKKPTVYLDTSIISAYWYEGADVAMIVRRMRTREWWELERHHFGVWASTFGEAELRGGVFPRQSECVSMIRRLRYLPARVAVQDLSDQVLERGLVPRTKPADAVHLAICAWHGIDFLLTWNYAHMANPVVQARFERLCGEVGLIVPLMVSPESIPQVRLGNQFGGIGKMADPILDELWRVREELVKKHGGLHGYFKYIQKLELARSRSKQRSSAHPSKPKVKKAR
jgi:predicted nucleic acid-binding protein